MSSNGVDRPESGESSGESTDALPTIGVVGLGYVGLRLAHTFDDAGHTVNGFDVDDTRIRRLRRGDDPTNELGAAALESGSVSYTTDPGRLGDCQYVFLSVPTPITDSNEPDLSAVEAAGETTGRHLSAGTMVVLESTVYPGATREVLQPALEAASGLRAGEDFSLAYSPERVVPGTEGRDFRDIVKVVSALRETSARRLHDLYDRLLDAEVHIAPTIETAEAAKCLENAQRDLNIALMNEFAIACNEADFDLRAEDVLTAAGTKWNFHEYRPGFVGGHCLPIDPYFLVHQFERHGATFDLPQVARRVNEHVPTYVATRLVEALERRERAAGPQSPTDRLLIAGVTYKPESADVRFGPVQTLIEEARQHGLSVVGYEPHAEEDALEAAFEMPFQSAFDPTGFDALAVPTAHPVLRDLDLQAISEAMNHDPVLADVTGAFSAAEATERGFTYLSL